MSNKAETPKTAAGTDARVTAAGTDARVTAAGTDARVTAAGTDAPVAAQDPVETVVWGRTLVDPYRWLQDKESEAVLAHLEAENRHTEAVLAPVAELREELYAEIKGRIKETDMSVPVVKDQWSYYTRTNEGDQYAIHCRRPAPEEGGRSDRSGGGPATESPEGEPVVDEQILLDENLEAGDSEFFELGLFDVSPDHRLLLWGADRTGDERFDAVVRDLETGEEFHDGLLDLSYGSAWALDNETFFYVRPDDANRPHEVWRHTVGQPVADDMLVFREDDERFFVGVARDKDDSYIHIGSSSKITDELRIVPADDPIAVPRLIAERRQGVEYSAAHVDDRFIILTNDGAENFRVMTAPEDDPGPDNWSELIPEAPDVTISDIDVSAHFLVLFERTEGTTRIRLRSWRDGSFTTVDQPEEVSTTWPGANPDFNATTLRYGYTSMVTPPSVFLLDTESGERELLKQQEVLGDFDPANYDTKREWATAKDGTRIPISLVWRKDAAGLGSGPDEVTAEAAARTRRRPKRRPGTRRRPKRRPGTRRRPKRRPGTRRRPKRRPETMCALCLRGIRGVHRSGVLVGSTVASRSWLLLCHRPCPGRRRNGTTVVPPGKIREEAEHLRRRHCGGRAPAHQRLDRCGPAGVAGRVGRGADGRRRGQSGAATVRRGGGPCAVRRRPQHHPRSEPAPDRHRVGGVGEPRRERGDLRGNGGLLAL